MNLCVHLRHLIDSALDLAAIQKLSKRNLNISCLYFTTIGKQRMHNFFANKSAFNLSVCLRVGVFLALWRTLFLPSLLCQFFIIFCYLPVSISVIFLYFSICCSICPSIYLSHLNLHVFCKADAPKQTSANKWDVENSYYKRIQISWISST